MKVYKVTPDTDLNPCSEKSIDNVIPWLEMAEIGEKITIEVIEMTEAEYDALPEYRGP